jgi:hypothetical protein
MVGWLHYFTRFTSQPDRKVRSFPVASPPSSNSSMMEAIPAIYPDISTGSDTSLGFAKSWLNNCLTSHESCRRPGEILPPTRLIELFEGGIRLCHTKDMACCPAYLTLSHCVRIFSFLDSVQTPAVLVVKLFQAWMSLGEDE